jgi:hypothetical protein
MARTPDDRITHALAILSAVQFSRSINGYVLSRDQRNQLLAILEEDGEADDAPSKRTKKS